MNIPDLKMERAKKSDLYDDKNVHSISTCLHTQKYLPLTTNFNNGLFLFIKFLYYKL
jgi:hypothetical protein